MPVCLSCVIWHVCAVLLAPAGRAFVDYSCICGTDQVYSGFEVFETESIDGVDRPRTCNRKLNGEAGRGPRRKEGILSTCSEVKEDVDDNGVAEKCCIATLGAKQCKNSGDNDGPVRAPHTLLCLTLRRVMLGHPSHKLCVSAWPKPRWSIRRNLFLDLLRPYTCVNDADSGGTWTYDEASKDIVCPKEGCKEHMCCKFAPDVNKPPSVGGRGGFFTP